MSGIPLLLLMLVTPDGFGWYKGPPAFGQNVDGAFRTSFIGCVVGGGVGAIVLGMFAELISRSAGRLRLLVYCASVGIGGATVVLCHYLSSPGMSPWQEGLAVGVFGGSTTLAASIHLSALPTKQNMWMSFKCTVVGLVCYAPVTSLELWNSRRILLVALCSIMYLGSLFSYLTSRGTASAREDETASFLPTAVIRQDGPVTIYAAEDEQGREATVIQSNDARFKPLLIENSEDPQ